jgi:hypothetical protein
MILTRFRTFILILVEVDFTNTRSKIMAEQLLMVKLLQVEQTISFMLTLNKIYYGLNLDL